MGFLKTAFRGPDSLWWGHEARTNLDVYYDWCFHSNITLSGLVKLFWLVKHAHSMKKKVDGKLFLLNKEMRWLNDLALLCLIYYYITTIGTHIRSMLVLLTYKVTTVKFVLCTWNHLPSKNLFSQPNISEFSSV
jgi:hypothetical protein